MAVVVAWFYDADKSVTASDEACSNVACGWPKDSCGAGVGDAVAVFIVMAQAKAHPPTAAL
jgi:hypothetical protein